jgi:dTDP-4-dehydrorhamnose reductase
MSTVKNFLQNNMPEIWGGIEGTINRVGNKYRDQAEYAGHYLRTDDIDKFSELGISKLRYPLLWEHHVSNTGEDIDWTWAARQLQQIRKNNITPIVGLVHHGSGPLFTNLLDEDFPNKLAGYARQVATRFPWLEFYTPVNEPLTTARFSGLYGLWYPHHQNELSFIKMLLNQVKGTVLSMQAIRDINPNAKLVQTEDLAKTHATVKLQYQADFENKRRWLTYDLLCGKVTKRHFFWKYFTSAGINEKDLQFFLDNSCPPDIMGYNYYVTSERWLDEKIENYPACTHGGNNKDMYADSEAVRSGRAVGLKALIREAWERYKKPLAITECHLNCTREEQMRWLKETWEDCLALGQEGIPLKAVTAWALLGSYDWDTLLTRYNNHYETGVFDVRSNSLRSTSLGKMVRAFAQKQDYSHPLLSEKGWWNRDPTIIPDRTYIKKTAKKPLLIVGSTGALGSALVQICQQRFIPYVGLNENYLSLLNANRIDDIINENKPWAVLNADGYYDVERAEQNAENCFKANAVAPGLWSTCCRKAGVQFLTFSSDMVFNGEKKDPYNEMDAIMPLNVFGQSKAKAEKMVLQNFPDSLIIRVGPFFGRGNKLNFVDNILEAVKQKKTFFVPSDVVFSPAYMPDLLNAALDLLIDEEKGIWHISNSGAVTWFDFANLVAERARYKKDNLVAKPLNEMDWFAKRPYYSALISKKGIELPRFENALERYLELRPD